MPNDILKLMEGGIDLVLSGGETYRGENWHDENNIAQNDERITVLMENTVELAYFTLMNIKFSVKY